MAANDSYNASPPLSLIIEPASATPSPPSSSDISWNKRAIRSMTESRVSLISLAAGKSEGGFPEFQRETLHRSGDASVLAADSRPVVDPRSASSLDTIVLGTDQPVVANLALPRPIKASRLPHRTAQEIIRAANFSTVKWRPGVVGLRMIDRASSGGASIAMANATAQSQRMLTLPSSGKLTSANPKSVVRDSGWQPPPQTQDLRDFVLLPNETQCLSGIDLEPIVQNYNGQCRELVDYIKEEEKWQTLVKREAEELVVAIRLNDQEPGNELFRRAGPRRDVLEDLEDDVIASAGGNLADGYYGPAAGINRERLEVLRQQIGFRRAQTEGFVSRQLRIEMDGDIRPPLFIQNQPCYAPQSAIDPDQAPTARHLDLVVPVVGLLHPCQDPPIYDDELTELYSRPLLSPSDEARHRAELFQKALDGQRDAVTIRSDHNAHLRPMDQVSVPEWFVTFYHSGVFPFPRERDQRPVRQSGLGEHFNFLLNALNQRETLAQEEERGGKVSAPCDWSQLFHELQGGGVRSVFWQKCKANPNLPVSERYCRLCHIGRKHPRPGLARHEYGSLLCVMQHFMNLVGEKDRELVLARLRSGNGRCWSDGQQR